MQPSSVKPRQPSANIPDTAERAGTAGPGTESASAATGIDRSAAIRAHLEGQNPDGARRPNARRPRMPADRLPHQEEDHHRSPISDESATQGGEMISSNATQVRAPISGNSESPPTETVAKLRTIFEKPGASDRFEKIHANRPQINRQKARRSVENALAPRPRPDPGQSGRQVAPSRRGVGESVPAEPPPSYEEAVFGADPTIRAAAKQDPDAMRELMGLKVDIEPKRKRPTPAPDAPGAVSPAPASTGSSTGTSITHTSITHTSIVNTGKASSKPAFMQKELVTTLKVPEEDRLIVLLTNIRDGVERKWMRADEVQAPPVAAFPDGLFDRAAEQTGYPAMSPQHPSSTAPGARAKAAGGPAAPVSARSPGTDLHGPQAAPVLTTTRTTTLSTTSTTMARPADALPGTPLNAPTARSPANREMTPTFARIQHYCDAYTRRPANKAAGHKTQPKPDERTLKSELKEVWRTIARLHRAAADDKEFYKIAKLARKDKPTTKDLVAIATYIDSRLNPDPGRYTYDPGNFKNQSDVLKAANDAKDRKFNDEANARYIFSAGTKPDN